MKAGPTPQWMKISEMPRVAWMIDGMLEAAEQVHSSLRGAKEKPHTIDDYTIDRIYEVHGTQLDELWLYEEQLRRFEKEKTSVEQGKEIDRLTAQVMKLRGVLNSCIKLAEEIREGTINRIMEMDSTQLATEVILGKRKLPF